MEQKFLYGASVQGIQSFIFQTSKLAEIVGASELVEQICTSFFKDQIGEENFKDDNLILGAAGNIKYLFDDAPSCQELVKKFPKAVMEMAPGITISQAVVRFEAGGLNNALQELENKLRTQRNKVSMPYEIGFMGTERSRRTGGVAFQNHRLAKGDEDVDEATSKKLKGSENDILFEKISNNIAVEDPKIDLLTNIDDLFKNENNTWLAVIHADGNGLGAIIQNLNNSFKGKDDDVVKKGFKEFSKALDNSTKTAAQIAFDQVVKDKKKGGKPYPIRPIILSGDDLTVIIKADLAFDFTIKFLKEFEEQSQKHLEFLNSSHKINGFKNGITACAGIAYVKKSYPFHYAVDLAEKLCSDAKNFVKSKGEYENMKDKPEKKGLVPKSSLAFFKVQDSFIEYSLKEMKKRVLQLKEINFSYGPYLIEQNDSFPNVIELKRKLKTAEKYEEEKVKKDESKGISKLRQWVTEIFRDKTTADFMLDRMSVINKDFYNEMKPKDLKNEKSIIYDVIQLNSFQD